MIRLYPVIRERAVQSVFMLASKRALTFLLMLVMAWAPVLPSFAMTLKVGDNTEIHVTHDGKHADMSHPAAPKQKSCTQHDSCNDRCCAFCAQYFSATPLISLDLSHSHPVQTPILTELHPRIFSASLDRPPRFLSL